MISVQHYLVVSAILFSIGVIGLLTRRSALVALLSIELILNASNLSFVAFSSFLGDLSGQIVVFFSMIVAAAEITVGLAIIILLFRKTNTIQIDQLNELKG